MARPSWRVGVGGGRLGMLYARATYRRPLPAAEPLQRGQAHLGGEIDRDDRGRLIHTRAVPCFDANMHDIALEQIRRGAFRPTNVDPADVRVQSDCARRQ
jgi:hypothetical protein